MLQTLLQFLDNSSKNFLETLKRFPLVSFFAFLLTLILIIFLSSTQQAIENYPNYPIANKIAFTSILAIPLFIVLRLISNNRILTLLGILLIAGYYLLLPDSFENDSIVIQRHVLLTLALIVLIFPAPFLFRPVKNAKFWEWTQQVIFALLSAVVFGFIIYLGFQGALYAFKRLFYFQLNHHLSQQLLIAIFGIFSMNYFLAQIPKYPLLVPIRPYTKIENIFTKYILTPLSIAYFFILYSYTIKTIYLTELPSGMLAWLVVIFSAVAITTFFFWTPLWNEKNYQYKKWIWIAILLQTLLLGLSIYLRIEQYGITQNRYFIALIGLWLFSISLYFIFYKNALYKWIFLTFSILIIFSQLGSFSANSMAQKSQSEQLIKLLAEHPKLSEESEADLRYQISSTIDYLYQKHGIDSFMPILPKVVSEFKLQDEKNEDCSTPTLFYFPQYATQHLGFKYIDEWQWKQELEKKNSKKIKPIRIYLQQENSLDIEGYKWLQNFEYDNYNNKSFCPPSNENKIPTVYTIITKEKEVIIQKESKELAVIDINEFLKNLKNIIKNKDQKISNNDYYRGSKLTQKKLTYLYTNRNIEVKILFKHIYFNPKDKLEHYQGTLLINEK